MECVLTAPYYSDGGVTLCHGDCLDVLRTLPDASVDAMVTDPPAGVGFMGREWDGDKGGRRQWIAWMAERMTEALRVVKPGGHALVWALPRTSHWTATALEDAGWEVRDCVVHHFASGFPKALDVSRAIDKAAGAQREVVGINPRAAQQTPKGDATSLGRFVGTSLDLTAPATDAARQWEGWATALKPASEMWWLVRRPLSGMVAANVLEYGTGALNIGGCRVATSETLHGSTVGNDIRGGRFAAGYVPNPGDIPAYVQSESGRWPSNALWSHAPECGPDDSTPCVDGCPVAELDDQGGTLKSGANPTRRGSDKFRDAYGEFAGQTECTPARGADSGTASRFFPTFRYQAKADTAERPKLGGVAHPTVKSLELMRFLTRLVTPPGGVVLDPFAGSGTTAEACLLEGFRCIMVEREADYLPLIVDRITAHRDPVAHLAHKVEHGEDVDLGLFAFLGEATS